MKYWRGPRYSKCEIPDYYKEFFYLISRKTKKRVLLKNLLSECDLKYVHRESKKYFIHSYGHFLATYELGASDAQLIGLKYEAPFMKMLWYFHKRLNSEYEIWVKPDHELAEDYLEYNENSPTHFYFKNCEKVLQPLEWELKHNTGITLGYFESWWILTNTAFPPYEECFQGFYTFGTSRYPLPRRISKKLKEWKKGLYDYYENETITLTKIEEDEFLKKKNKLGFAIAKEIKAYYDRYVPVAYLPCTQGHIEWRDNKESVLV